MPSTVRQLLKAAGLALGGTVQWGTPIAISSSGVYIVSLSSDPDLHAQIGGSVPLDTQKLKEWINAVPAICVDGNVATPISLCDRLAEHWIPDESVLYIGKASTLKDRVRGYYRTALGDWRPHAGGHWIKALSVLDDIYVHYAESAEPAVSEATLLDSFVSEVSESSKSVLRDPEHPFPFANLEFPPGTRKKHGITNQKEPK